MIEVEGIQKKDRPASEQQAAQLDEQPVPVADAPPAHPRIDVAAIENIADVPECDEANKTTDPYYRQLQAQAMEGLEEGFAVEQQLKQLGVGISAHLNVATLLACQSSVEAVKEILCQSGLIDRNQYTVLFIQLLARNIAGLRDEVRQVMQIRANHQQMEMSLKARGSIPRR